VFLPLSWTITREDKNGRRYPGEAISRAQALKAATLHGAYYMLKEDVLGSLEPGKFADFLVLDRDYMTIPEDDIKKIKPLMTVLGGKVVHLTPALAKELNMPTTGAMAKLGPAAKY
jgi:predicted amidohydrolase YtcJ